MSVSLLGCIRYNTMATTKAILYMYVIMGLHLNILMVLALKETTKEDLFVSGKDQIDETMSHLLDEARYAKSSPPSKTEPTEVKIGIYVNSFYAISEQTMDFSVSFYLRQAWSDRRLAFTPISLETGHRKVNVSKIRLGQELFDKIWLPDTFFRNEKAAEYHDVTVDNRLLTVNSQGDVWFVVKIKATFSCPMNLHKFPMDTHHCPIMFESFGYTMDTMFYSWLPSPADVDPNVRLPQFKLRDVILYDCSQNYTAGAFPCLQMSFVINRNIGYYVTQVYLPSSLMVVLSWFSFWIDPEATEIRVSVGLLTLVTITTTATGAISNLPIVSYIKAIDVWMSVCLVFIILSLLEVGIVHLRSLQSKPPAPAASAAKATRPNYIIISIRRGSYSWRSVKSAVKCRRKGNTTRTSSSLDRSSAQIRIKSNPIDMVSRYVFPLGFVLFNVVYWVVYTLPMLAPAGR